MGEEKQEEEEEKENEKEKEKEKEAECFDYLITLFLLFPDSTTDEGSGFYQAQAYKGSVDANERFDYFIE